MNRLLQSITCFFLFVSMGAAQQPAKSDTEQKSLSGIEWLKQFKGTWATEYDGTMKSRVLADKWLVSEISFNGKAFSVQTLGWDEKKKKFVGTWVDGTSSHVWHYSGWLDDSGRKIILEAEGPDMQEPSIMRLYRDSYEFVSADEIHAATKFKNSSGKWELFNKAKMTRKLKQ